MSDHVKIIISAMPYHHLVMNTDCFYGMNIPAAYRPINQSSTPCGAAVMSRATVASAAQLLRNMVFGQAVF